MPPRVANIAPCITQVTFKLVHYALLINQLRLYLIFFKVLANFWTDKYGLDCGLEINAKVFQLHLNNVSGVLVLEEYDYSGYVISRQFSRSLQWLLVSNSRVGKDINGRVDKIETKVYVKPTNTGLLVHHQSHVDNRYKRSLLTTMLDRAYRLSSSWLYFSEECERLKSLFLCLDYPHHLINSRKSHFERISLNLLH